MIQKKYTNKFLTTETIKVNNKKKKILNYKKEKIYHCFFFFGSLFRIFRALKHYYLREYLMVLQGITFSALLIKNIFEIDRGHTSTTII